MNRRSACHADHRAAIAIRVGHVSHVDQAILILVENSKREVVVAVGAYTVNELPAGSLVGFVIYVAYAMLLAISNRPIYSGPVGVMVDG